jgi:hypothetical protein
MLKGHLLHIEWMYILMNTHDLIYMQNDFNSDFFL